MARAVGQLTTSAARVLERPDVRFAQLVFAATLAFLIFVGFLFPAPVSVLFLGAVLGSLSALIAMGIVLVYRANRIINFAQGDIGGLAAVLAVSLIARFGWSFYPAFSAALLVALACGCVIEFVFIRRFSQAPRLILTVATLGIALLLQAGEVGLPRAFGYTVAPQNFPTPLDVTFSWHPLVFQGSHVFALLMVPVVAAGLGAFLRFTRLGKAIRASAESADRALLLGIPVRRINLVVWVLAAGLSGITAVLRAPLVGVPIGAVLGPGLLLRALAAAVIGRMENLTVTFFAGVGLGIVEQAVYWDRGNTSVVDAVLFVAVMAVLLVQRRRASSRAGDVGASTWTSIADVRPVPPELRPVPEVRYGFPALGLAVVAFLVLAPRFLDVSEVNLLGYGVILALIGVSLMTLTGWAGQISLGQWAFVGFGSAVAGKLAQNGWNFFLTLLVAGLVGLAVSLVIGLPALRIRGLFLAVATFAFAVAAQTYFLSAQHFPWLIPRLRVLRPVLFGKFDLESETAFYYFLLVVFGLVLLSVRSVRNSRTGRVLVASRDNERAAQSFGVNLVRTRLVGFAFAGFIAALTGALFVYHQHGMNNNSFSAPNSIRLFSMAVLGGLGSVAGIAMGATFFTLIDYFVTFQWLRLLTSGAGLLLVLMIVPGGLSQVLYGTRDRYLRWAARRRGIDVPSLLPEGAGPPARGQPPQLPGPAEGEPARRGSLLDVQSLDVSYGRTQVLFDVDFRVEEGAIVALLGTNGAGKSTLLKAVAGLVPATAGRVWFGGSDTGGTPANKRAAEGIVLVPGGRGVFPTLTVAENLELAGWLYQKDRAYLEAAHAQVLDYFPILRERSAQKAGNLSGGEQQMLTLAQAFIARPRLLMIDELSLGLAPVVVERLLEIVRAIHARGTTVILVEQSVNVAITLAHRAVFLEKGQVRFDGPTAELLDRPDILRAVFLSGATSARQPARPAAQANGFVSRCEVCGHEHPVALETRGLAVTFGGVRALDDVDLSVHQGQVVGVIGPNGAGKTTLLDLISGFVPPTSGRVIIGGADATDASPSDRAAAGLGRSFQDAHLFPSMTVAEVLAVAFERHVPTRDPLAAALVSPATRASERVVRQRVAELLELMNLGAFANKFVSELSTGTRRIVDLACALAHRPNVLLLDEPSSGIAQRETEALAPVLLDIRDRTGAALVVIEHDIPLVTSISDHLVALDLGRVVARGRPDEVIQSPVVVASYLGSSEEAIRRSGTRAGDGARRRAGVRRAARA